MITETTFARLDKLMASMDAARKARAQDKARVATTAIATQIRLNSAIRTIKQIQARQAARK